MGIEQVDKLERAANALRGESDETGLEAPDIQFWLASTGGFTKEVMDRVSSRDDLYASNHDGINRIFRKFGGSFTIQVFVKNS